MWRSVLELGKSDSVCRYGVIFVVMKLLREFAVVRVDVGQRRIDVLSFGGAR